MLPLSLRLRYHGTNNAMNKKLLRERLRDIFVGVPSEDPFLKLGVFLETITK
jgi:hypothetical protein